MAERVRRPRIPASVIAFLLVLTVLVTYVAAGSVIPLVPHAVLDRGGGLGLVSVVASIFFFSAVAGRLIGGMLADRLGRGPVLIAGIGLIAASGGAYLLADGPALLGLARGVHGFGVALLFTAVAAAVVDLVPGTGRLFGLLGAGAWSGYAIGAVLAPWVNNLGAAGLLVVGGAAGALVVVVLSYRRVAAGDPALRIPPAAPDSRLSWRAFVIGTAVLPAVLFGMGNVGYGVLQAYLPILAATGDGARGLAVFGLVVLASRLLLGGTAERWGVRRSLWTGVLLTAGSMASLPLVVHIPAAFYGALAIAAFAYSLAWPVLASWTVARSSPQVTASALATLTAGNDLFISGSLAVVGAVVGAAGTPDVAFYLPALLGALVLVLVEATRRRGPLTVGKTPADPSR
ncbi:MFS transporter [Pseudonocardia sp. GCM10023141]|uniref:MFS transporter n=1 Tax=Pseudonocardia sp. GCM10023141 TaxID=3252653 RepID=UPI003620B11F